jgi:hypothetical protein
MLSFSISYLDLIKFPYLADLTQKGNRGWKEAQRQGEHKIILRKNLLLLFFGVVHLALNLNHVKIKEFHNVFTYYDIS